MKTLRYKINRYIYIYTYKIEKKKNVRLAEMFRVTIWLKYEIITE